MLDLTLNRAKLRLCPNVRPNPQPALRRLNSPIFTASRPTIICGPLFAPITNLGKFFEYAQSNSLNPCTHQVQTSDWLWPCIALA
jgi:hypothetical protein